MDTSIIQLSAQALLLVPIVMALVELAKLYINVRWAPLLSLAFGIAAAFIIPSSTAGYTVLSGLIIGLTAAGLYSGVKATVAPSTPTVN